MPQITVTISDAQAQALSFVTSNTQDWVEDAITARASSATEELVRICVNRCLAAMLPIPSTREEMVALAFAQGWVKTVAQQEAEVRALAEQNG